MTVEQAPDQAFWTKRWRGTVWELANGDHWLPLGTPSEALVVVSAWNPGSLRLAEAINQARDGVLAAELRALGLAPVRARGRSADRAWCEEGWLIAHLPTRTTGLLQRYGQIAGWVTEPLGSRYVWANPTT